MNPAHQSFGLTPAQACYEGYYFCHHCDHIVKLHDDAPTDAKQKCPHCKKREVVWHYPLKDFPKPIPNPSSK